jgi:hypothetical protein
VGALCTLAYIAQVSAPGVDASLNGGSRAALPRTAGRLIQIMATDFRARLREKKGGNLRAAGVSRPCGLTSRVVSADGCRISLHRPKWGVELQIPLARYFLWVGGVLLALLFVADAYLPTLEGLPVALPVLSRRRPGPRIGIVGVDQAGRRKPAGCCCAPVQ